LELTVPPSFYQALLRHHSPTYWTTCPDFTYQANAIRKHVLHFNKGALTLPLDLLFSSYPAFKDLAIMGIPPNSKPFFEPFLATLKIDQSPLSSDFSQDEEDLLWNSCAKYHMDHFKNLLGKVDFNKTFHLECCGEQVTLNQLATNYTCPCGYNYYYSFCLEAVQCNSISWHCSECNKCTQNPLQCLNCNASSEVSDCALQ
jgi:hypothetical protein